MKKLLSFLLCLTMTLSVCISSTVMSVCASETDFEISKGSVSNGDTSASISALYTFEFTKELAQVQTSDVSVKNASSGSAAGIKEVVVTSNKLTIRTSSVRSYNKEYIIDLSNIKSVDGDSLPAEQQSVSFTTKAGTKETILEDDFEMGTLNTSKWRNLNIKNNKVEISPVDSDAGNGNYSYKVVDANFDTYNYGENKPTYQPLRLSDKAVLKFKILTSELTNDYNFMTCTMFYNNSTKNLTTAGDGMLKYFYETNSLGVHATYNPELSSTTNGLFHVAHNGYGAQATLKENAWNDVSVFVDVKAHTFKVVINGVTMTDNGGRSEFYLPSKTMVTSEFDDFQLRDVAISSPGSGKGAVYFDDVCYTEFTEGTESIGELSYENGTAKVEIAKNVLRSSIADKIMLAVASYTADNELVALKAEEFILSQGETKEYSVSLDDFNDGIKQKAFLWSVDNDAIIPLTK